jgi:tRNA (mo5U34)-methyltransferase
VSIDDRPTTQDDPRLRRWYHTIELGEGIVSQGVYDHRSIVDRYGLPESLAGKTALDVGTADGFWAFELERRGAEVVAIDIARHSDFDWLPEIREALGETAGLGSHFRLAREMRGSQVTYETCNVYDLSSERLGTFDVVFCGDVIQHLMDPLRALINIRSVTRELAVVATLIEPELEERFADRPWLRFGHRDSEATLGEAAIYWRFTTSALAEMMEYAGFARTEPQEAFSVPPVGINSTSVVGHVDPT